MCVLFVQGCSDNLCRERRRMWRGFRRCRSSSQEGGDERLMVGVGVGQLPSRPDKYLVGVRAWARRCLNVFQDVAPECPVALLALVDGSRQTLTVAGCRS